MTTRSVLRRIPGIGALLILVVMTTVSAVSGASSLFYEGWGQPLPAVLLYLAPAAALMAIGLVAVRRPRTGGALLLGTGLVGGAWWFAGRLSAEMAPPGVLLMTLAVILVPVVVTSALLFVDARLRARREGDPPRTDRRGGWMWQSAVLVLVPAAGLAIVSYQQVPALLSRHDDGQRGARVIEGNDGTTLVWAPQGPGWNGRTPAGTYPSWIAVAGSRASAPGRCALLDEAGTALLDQPVGTWRLPSVGEIVQALSRGGVNAGCRWDRRSPHSTCRVPPDKETPLWDPDEPPIYYWSADEASPGRAFAVNYTGGIGVHSAAAEGAGIGFRCVKPAGAPPGTR